MRRLREADPDTLGQCQVVGDYQYTVAGARVAGSFTVAKNTLGMPSSTSTLGRRDAWTLLTDGQRTVLVTQGGRTVRCYDEYNLGGSGALATFFLGVWGPYPGAAWLRRALVDGTADLRRLDDGGLVVTVPRTGENKAPVTNLEITLDSDLRLVRMVRVVPIAEGSRTGPISLWTEEYVPGTDLPRVAWSSGARLLKTGTPHRYLRLHRFTYFDRHIAPDDVLALARSAPAIEVGGLGGMSKRAYAAHIDAQVQRLRAAPDSAVLATLDVARQPHTVVPRLAQEGLSWPSLVDFKGAIEAEAKADLTDHHREFCAQASLAFLIGHRTRTPAPFTAAIEKAPAALLSLAEVRTLAAAMGAPLEALELDGRAARRVTEPFLVWIPGAAGRAGHMAVGLPRKDGSPRAWVPPGSTVDPFDFPQTTCFVSPADAARLRATASTRRVWLLALGAVGALGAGLLWWRSGRARDSVAAAALLAALLCSACARADAAADLAGILDHPPLLAFSVQESTRATPEQVTLTSKVEESITLHLQGTDCKCISWAVDTIEIGPRATVQVPLRVRQGVRGVERVRLPIQVQVGDRIVAGVLQARIETKPGILMLPPRVTAQCDANGVARSAFSVLLRRPRLVPQALNWKIDGGFDLVVEKIQHEPGQDDTITDKYEMTLVADTASPGSHVVSVTFSHPLPHQVEARHSFLATVPRR